MKGRLAMVAAMMMAVTLAGCTEVAGERDLTGFAELSPCDVDVAVPEPRFPVAIIDTNFGTIKADIFLDMVPVTAQNFIDLAEAGKYDDTPFHRIITDFMMQGGDFTMGNGRGGEAADGGTIPDEFHHLLRHDGKGMLSMANSGPNTGGSQFFITFKETPWLDDKHSVFGQVIDGMDVLDKVNDEASSTDGTPVEPITLESVTIDYEERSTVQGFGADLFAYDADQPVPSNGGWARFIVVAESQAVGMLPVCFAADAPEGVTIQMEQVFHNVDLPARQRVAVVVDVESDGPATVPITLQGPGGELARLDLQMTGGGSPGKVVQAGDSVTGNYIGVTVDGRVFDTSVKSVADHVWENDLGYSTFQHRGSYSTFTFTPGSKVIQGFTDIAVGTPEGMSGVGRVAPKDAYGEQCPPQPQNCPPLAGRTLVFQLDVLDVK